MKLSTILPLLIVGCLLLQSGLSAGQRAMAWKPERTPGLSQLSVDDLDFLVQPDSASEALKAAIGDFTELYASRYGKKIELVSVGSPERALSFERVDRTVVGGAFSIVTERKRVTIQAGGAEGWQNGLYAIMHDLMGARWYWGGGDLGFEWVTPQRKHFPNRPWVEAPTFVQRNFYPVETSFGRRNRLNQVYSFNHNLAKVFSAEVFEEKPEVFAAVNLRRQIPKGSGGTDPQPDFTEPGAVEVAAAAALAHFEAKPESVSYSLSINDNTLFDTRARTQAVVEPLRYFRERPDYTDLVFGFMNQVAERVFEEAGAWKTPGGEDRYLTALAYFWTEPAPTIRLHPRVMPVLTSDRAQWHDPEYREEDKALIRAWMAAGAERVATWDYYFGAPYLYPRQFNEWIAESIPFMADAGIDVFFSQLPSFWGLDGAKAWLSAELLWDSQQDAEALLEEYYVNFFGQAASPMRSFYQTAERHRNANEGKARWIKLYLDEAGIALFTPEVLQEMRAHLDRAQALASGDARRLARVEIVSEAFELTELCARYDGSRRKLVELCVDGADVEAVAMQLEAYREARAAYLDYREQYLANSPYAPKPRQINFTQSNPEPLAAAILEAQPEDSFTSLVTDPELPHSGKETRNFLGPELPKVDDWQFAYRASEHFSVTASDWSTGAAGIRIGGSDAVSITGSFPVQAEQVYELRLRAAWQVSLDSRLYIHAEWRDEDGKRLRSRMPLRIPMGQRADPADVPLRFVAPENAAKVRFQIVGSRQPAGDFFDISRMDFGLIR